MLTWAHWELTWCLEGTLASFASPDKPSDNKRDEGYHCAAIANPFSRVPLSGKPFEPINHPRTDTSQELFTALPENACNSARYCQLTLQCQGIDSRPLLLKVSKARYCIFNVRHRVRKIPASESKRRILHML